MSVFAVAYDLNSPGKDYKKLLDALRAMDSLHAQKSMWLVNTVLLAVPLVQALSQHVDSNDAIWASEVTPAWASWKMPAAVTWLRARGL